jgi:hypothetical protein
VITELEGRTLLAINTGSTVVNVHPAILPPTDSQYLPVHIYGKIASTRPSGVTAFFFVTDEYRRDEPTANIALGPPVFSNNLYFSSFDFTIHLQAKRSTKTPDGRHYDIFVGAKDKDDTDGRTVAVYVPKTFPPPPTVTVAHVHSKPKPGR